MSNATTTTTKKATKKTVNFSDFEFSAEFIAEVRDAFFAEHGDDFAGLGIDSTDFWNRGKESFIVSAFLESHGVKVSTRRELVKMTNTRFHNGMLSDGICHYQHQTTIAGDTYHFRAGLKAAGYRFDPAAKLWYKKMICDGGESIADNYDFARYDAASIVLKTFA